MLLVSCCQYVVQCMYNVLLLCYRCKHYWAALCGRCINYAWMQTQLSQSWCLLHQLRLHIKPDCIKAMFCYGIRTAVCACRGQRNMQNLRPTVLLHQIRRPGLLLIWNTSHMDPRSFCHGVPCKHLKSSSHSGHRSHLRLTPHSGYTCALLTSSTLSVNTFRPMQTE